MIDKKDILKELSQKFEEVKKELGFTPSFEELDREFSLKDAVLTSGFVSDNLVRQISSRIVEFYRDWHGYLNNLLLPNPSFYAGQTEAKLFNSDEDRKKIWKLVTISMRFSSKNSLAWLTGENDKEKEFINEAYSSWINEFKPGLIYLMDKVHDGWKKE